MHISKDKEVTWSDQGQWGDPTFVQPLVMSIYVSVIFGRNVKKTLMILFWTQESVAFATATFLVTKQEILDDFGRKSKVGLPQQCEPELFFVNPRWSCQAAVQLQAVAERSVRFVAFLLRFLLLFCQSDLRPVFSHTVAHRKACFLEPSRFQERKKFVCRSQSEPLAIPSFLHFLLCVHFRFFDLICSLLTCH